MTASARIVNIPKSLMPAQPLTIILFLLEAVMVAGLGGTGGIVVSTFGLAFGKFVEEEFVGTVEEGVELPGDELRVEDDF